MESIFNFGVEQKATEYARRIVNGEDREKVMQGLGPVFRAAIEKKLENESLKSETEKSSQEHVQKEFLHHEEEKMARQKEIEEREIEDQKQIEILRKELGVPEKQNHSDVVNSEVYNFPEEEKQELKKEDISYTPDRLQTILGSEISKSNFSGTLNNIAQGMYERYRTTEDSIFGSRYQNEIDVFIPNLKKAETVQKVAEIVSQLNDTLSEMVRNVEYGASAGIDNRDQEIKELEYLADDFNAFKNILDGTFEYALFEIVGKEDKNVELIKAKNEIYNLRSTISNLVNILYDKVDRLR
jgi:hypothetical protein